MDLKQWAKLSKNNAEGNCYHPVVHHCIDVGNCFRALWFTYNKKIRRRMASAFGLNESDVLNWFCFLAALHDIGKISPCFQIKAKSNPHLWPHLESNYNFRHVTTETYHSQCSQAIFYRFAAEEKLLDTDLLEEFCLTLGAHHGTFSKVEKLDNADLKFLRNIGWFGKKEKWATEQKEAYEYLTSYYKVKSTPKPVLPNKWKQWAYMALAGMISIADWVTSGEFPLAGEIELNKYGPISEQLAVQSVEKLGFNRLNKWKVNQHFHFDEVFGKTPNELQKHCIELSRSTSETSLVIIEYPPGSGKTEAAQTLAYHFIQKFGHAGMYFAMPSCATSNQMFSRSGEFTKYIASDPAMRTELLHSNSILNHEYLNLKSDTLEISEWFSAGRRKLLVPFGVGTVDQLLLGVLQTKYPFVRLLGMCNKCVIMDEVHAFDCYTTELIAQLIQWLGAMGCSVILLSATLTNEKRKRLVAAFHGRKKADYVSYSPYPRITVASRWAKTADGNPLVVTTHIPYNNKIKYQLKTVELSNCVSSIASKVQNGGCIGVFVNRVKRAQILYQELKREVPDADIILIHSKFPHSRRQNIENDLIAKFGKEGWRNGRPTKTIVISTQIMEQSLDLDFDVLYTDLAPIDILIQRMGRLHRADATFGVKLPRPDNFRNPTVYIMGNLAESDNFPDFGKDALIYHPYLLQKTYLALMQPKKDSIVVPDEIETLIEKVYEKYPEEIGPQQKALLEDSFFEFQNRQKRQWFKSFLRMIPSPVYKNRIFTKLLSSDSSFFQEEQIRLDAEGNEYESHPFYLGYQRKARTRIIAPTLSVVCMQKINGKYRMLGETECLDFSKIDDSMIESIYYNSINITDQKLLEAILENNCDGLFTPSEWSDKPFLRNLYLMEMDDNWQYNGPSKYILEEKIGLEKL